MRRGGLLLTRRKRSTAAPVQPGSSTVYPASSTNRIKFFVAPTSSNATITGAVIRLQATLNAGNVAFSDARDVRVADRLGVVLDYEIISYDSGTGAIDLDVKLPTYVGANGFIGQIAYGDAGLSDGQDATGTHSDFEAWWVFPSGSDKSGNGRNLTMANVASSTVFGRAGGNFTSTTALGTLGSFAWLNDLAGVSAMAVVDGTGNTGFSGIFAQGDTAASSDNQGGICLQVLGTASTGTNILHFKAGKNVTGGSYVISANEAGTMGEAVITASQKAGEVPRIWKNGTDVASGGVSQADNLLTQPGGFGVGRGLRTDGVWEGEIAVVAIRSRSVSAEMQAIESRSWSDPALIYGLSAEEASTDTNEYPLAVDVTATATADSTLDIDVLARSADPEGGALTLSVVGTPTGGSVSIVSNKARFVAPSTPGNYTFTFTVADSGALERSATCRVLVTAAASPTTYEFIPPPVPANANDIIVWNLTTGNNNTLPTHAADQVILGVLPPGGWSGRINDITNLKCPLIIMGGKINPPASISLDHSSGTRSGFGIVFEVTSTDTLYRSNPNFFWLSNVEIDQTVNSPEFGDIVRFGGVKSVTDINRIPRLYAQKILHTGKALAYFTSTTPGKENIPHTDWFQEAGAVSQIYLADIAAKWAGTFIFGVPSPSGVDEFIPGMACYMTRVTLDTSDRLAFDDRSFARLCDTYRASKIDIPNGKYRAFLLEDCEIKTDTLLTNPSDCFNPKSYGGGNVNLAGDTFSYPSFVGTGHIAPPFSGSCRYLPTLSSVVSASDVGDAQRVTTAEQLQSLWPGGTI